MVVGNDHLAMLLGYPRMLACFMNPASYEFHAIDLGLDWDGKRTEDIVCMDCVVFFWY